MRWVVLVLVLLLANQSNICARAAGKEPPRHLAPVYEERSGGVKVVAAGPGGLSLGVQYFGLDPVTTKCGPYSHSVYSQQLYDNTIISAERFGGTKRLGFGELVLTSTEDPCAHIYVLFEKYKQIEISPDYMVAPHLPGKTGTARGDAASLLLWFDPRYPEPAGGKHVTGTLTVERNKRLVLRKSLPPPSAALSGLDYFQCVTVPIAKTGFVTLTIDKPKRISDVIEWKVEKDGRVTHSGKVGFAVLPVVGGTVGYEVPIADHAKTP